MPHASANLLSVKIPSVHSKQFLVFLSVDVSFCYIPPATLLKLNLSGVVWEVWCLESLSSKRNLHGPLPALPCREMPPGSQPLPDIDPLWFTHEIWLHRPPPRIFIIDFISVFQLGDNALHVWIEWANWMIVDMAAGGSGYRSRGGTKPIWAKNSLLDQALEQKWCWKPSWWSKSLVTAEQAP